MQTLTEQLKKFKPASEHAVGELQEKLSDQVQQRFDTQGHRIDKLFETVLEGQKATQTNVDTLNSLLGVTILNCPHLSTCTNEPLGEDLCAR